MEAAADKPDQPAEDPYPDFVLSALDFPLDSLKTLHSYQLRVVLILLRRDATFEQKRQARDIFSNRRKKAAQELKKQAMIKAAEGKGADGEDEWAGDFITFDDVEVEQPLSRSQQKRADRWALATRKQRLHESLLAIEEPAPQQLPGDEEDSLLANPPWLASEPRITTTSTDTPKSPTSVDLDLSSPPFNDSTAPPGPAFELELSLSKKKRAALPMPSYLRDTLHIVTIADLPKAFVSQQLFLSYLLSSPIEPFPRPITFCRLRGGHFAVGFRSLQHAQLVVQHLNGQHLPHTSAKMSAKIQAGGVRNGGVDISHLSVEARDEWARTKQLPEAVWVGRVDKPEGARVSEAYEDELRALEEKVQKLGRQARAAAEEKWAERNRLQQFLGRPIDHLPAELEEDNANPDAAADEEASDVGDSTVAAVNEGDKPVKKEKRPLDTDEEKSDKRPRVD
ncbi:hypothetical protein JCM6882_001431 [Rhodosporidiobolus microsporus]